MFRTIACAVALAAQVFAQGFAQRGTSASTPTAVLEATVIAPDAQHPEITEPAELRRAAQDPLIGYYTSGGYWYTETCPSNSFYGTNGAGWGACCPDASQYCTYATACDGNKVVFVSGYGEADCYPNVCDTMTVFLSRGAGGTNVNSVINCFGTSNFYGAPRTFYRNKFFDTTPVSTSVSTSVSTKTPTSTNAPVTVTVTAKPGAAAPAGQVSYGVLLVLFLVAAAPAFGAVLL